MIAQALMSAETISVTLDRVNVLLVDPALRQDLPGLDAVLLREHLIVDIVHQPDDAPPLFILTQETGEMTHHAFNREGMGNEGGRIVVLAQQFICFVSGWFQVALLLSYVDSHLDTSYSATSVNSTGSVTMSATLRSCV
jgi:hypothetical protein